MKKMLIVIALIFVCLSSQPAHALLSFTGSLSTPAGITATEPWLTEGMTLSWTITENPDMTWNYSYQFMDYLGMAPYKAISHMILAISPNATASDFWDANGDMSVQIFDPSNPSNPGLPSSLYGLKIDVTNENMADIFTFVSNKAPVWGDFYIKDGTYNQNDVYAFNSTFGTPDPLAAPMNGSIDYKILRPDSFSTPIPEPTTLLLFGSAMALFGGVRKYRKK